MIILMPGSAACESLAVPRSLVSRSKPQPDTYLADSIDGSVQTSKEKTEWHRHGGMEEDRGADKTEHSPSIPRRFYSLCSEYMGPVFNDQHVRGAA